MAKTERVKIYFFKDLVRASRLIWEADKKLSFLNLLLQVTQALLPVISLFYLKEIVEAVTQGKDYQTLLSLIIASGLILLFSAVIRPYSQYINTVLHQKLNNYLAEKVITKVMETDYEYYEYPAYHDTLHLAQQQSMYRVAQLSDSLNAFLYTSFSFVMLIGFFATLHSLVALLLMMLAIPLAIVKWLSGVALFRLEKKYVPAQREADYLFDTLTGINSAKEVRTMDFGWPLVQKFRNIKSVINEEQRQLQSKYTWYSVLVESAEVIVVTLIFLFLAKQTWEKAITVGMFVIYLQGFQRMQSTSKSFLQVVVQIFQQRLFLKDLFNFLDLPSAPLTDNYSFPVLKTGIKISNLSFTYPQAKHAALSNISMEFPPGKVIAIVGENGSGKSTVVKLVARLYKKYTGSITADSVEFLDISLKTFRNATNFLFQDFEKYFFTIKENITLDSKKEVHTDDEVERAARISGAHDFIMKLKQGYQTRLGRLFEDSEQLSGGQWQKLALSRIFYRDAQLTVLDEPTSALDPTAELAIFKNIKEHLNHRTVVLITHRLYNVKVADYIYVMKDGNIVEEGSFETLINRDGLFSTMYKAQKI